jgi:hypothetical protein
MNRLLEISNSNWFQLLFMGTAGLGLVILVVWLGFESKR